MLTGKELFESGVILNCLEENIQQQGIDVRVMEVSEVRGTGTVPVEGKTIPPQSVPITPNNNNPNAKNNLHVTKAKVTPI